MVKLTENYPESGRYHKHWATNLRLYYTQNDHYTTNDASFLPVEKNYDFWSAALYVNPFVELLQQLHKWTKKISYTSDLLESTHPTAYVV